MESTAILVDAERKFMSKLCNAMTPVMVDAFYEMYKKAVETSKGHKTLIQFQLLLQDVPHWNNTMVRQHVDAITKSCSMFPNLLAAVFVLSVKILSAVRISSESKKINIKLPTNDMFVHQCYINIADALYQKPHVITERIPDGELRAKLAAMFTEHIKKVVDNLIPVDQILSTYIPNFTGELDMSGGDPTDPVEPEMTDEVPEPVESTPVATPLESTPAPETEGTPAPEVKKVAVHHETLFDDAKD